MVEIKNLSGDIIKTVDAKCLRYADLSGANLYGANLNNADLRSAKLDNADLRGANLYGADLGYADLRYAKLDNADLRDSDLRYADFYGANLHYADLQYADLHDGDLRNADLCGADLYGAKLSGANLYGAKLDNVKYNEWTAFFALQCPEEGSFIAFKKVNDIAIVKLLIPEDAERSSATTRKCRASKAKVLDIYRIDDKSFKLISITNTSYATTEYRVGEMVYPDRWDENRWNECSHGIHFFLTEQEAINY